MLSRPNVTFLLVDKEAWCHAIVCFRTLLPKSWYYLAGGNKAKDLLKVQSTILPTICLIKVAQSSLDHSTEFVCDPELMTVKITASQHRGGCVSIFIQNIAYVCELYRWEADDFTVASCMAHV